MFIRRVLALISACYVRGSTYITDCQSIQNINCRYPANIQHCVCSCAVARYITRQYIQIDYTQCSVFMRCVWGKSLYFSIHINNGSTEDIFSTTLKTDSNKLFILYQIETDLNHEKRYVIEVWTECTVCDDSCAVMAIEVPAVEYILSSTRATHKDNKNNIVIPLYAVVIPCTIVICITMFVLLYRKREDGLVTHNYYRTTSTVNSAL